MINILNYEKMKKIILKEYSKSNVFIYFKGIINTRVIINKARIIINKDRLIFANNDNDIVISLFDVRKLKIQDNIKISLMYNDDFEISLEV